MERTEFGTLSISWKREIEFRPAGRGPVYRYVCIVEYDIPRPVYMVRAGDLAFRSHRLVIDPCAWRGTIVFADDMLQYSTIDPFVHSEIESRRNLAKDIKDRFGIDDHLVWSDSIDEELHKRRLK